MSSQRYYDLTPEDFPAGEPVLKQKRGLWYRDNNSGYTDRLMEAGLYDREDALKYCFREDGKNGSYGVIAVPVRLALGGLTNKELEARIQKINDLMRYSGEKDE